MACRTKKPKRDLDRIVLDPGGRPVFDPWMTASGRGAYVCRTESCREMIGSRKGLKKAFRGASSARVLSCSPPRSERVTEG